MPADSSMPISQTIPGTTTIIASGSGHIHGFVLQPDADCYIQFFKADGTTAMSGKIHIKQYDSLFCAVQGNGMLISTAGIKLTVSGNTSGTINGFVTLNS
jgi:hypothetical protein